MGTTRSAEFTADGTWTCPTGVTAAWLTAVGGGAGSPGAGDVGSFIGAVGGAGAGEAVINKMIVVVPTTVYTVTVGNKGPGAPYNTDPTAPTGSSFAGFNALPAKGYFHPRSPSNSGSGGGPGGVPGMNAGGGRNVIPVREARHWTGGGAGGGGDTFSTANAYSSGGSSVHGGPFAGGGTGAHPGGPGGGSYWGNNAGGDTASAAPVSNSSHYGSGAGGPGAPASGLINGSDGVDGYVQIMWVE